MKNNELKLIKEYLKELKLSGIATELEEKVEEANKTEQSYELFLKEILELGIDKRRENGKLNRLRYAKFPYKKYIEDLEKESLPKEAQIRLKELKSLKFIEEGRNLILAGNAGTGKTHMAIGLGIEACMKGYKVLYVTIPLLINELKETRSGGKLRVFEKRFEKYDLVVCDELGYISFDKEGSELLFTFLSLRAGRKSTIITSNLPFNKWNEVFKDPVLTAALVDRLIHKSYVINMNGNSYRTKETLEWLKT
ncbi:IS21-like element helper ATPase IstB [Haliovirga abyssi]|uniref:ATP-binding protein n=1 Tax=Haliovirga abyssi TaxID=2996794 RepID=A0AAU9DCK6_9FUSO|nr:IS21-like element helper ATPase IstB [Haliovirga abyssi]BDU51055.1 ATP-binding protein [Haliovirga abyssi]